MLEQFVHALNSIGSNVWAFLAMLVGVFLCCTGHDIGKEMVMASFAILKVHIPDGKPQ